MQFLPRLPHSLNAISIFVCFHGPEAQHIYATITSTRLNHPRAHCISRATRHFSARIPALLKRRQKYFISPLSSCLLHPPRLTRNKQQIIVFLFLYSSNRFLPPLSFSDSCSFSTDLQADLQNSLQTIPAEAPFFPKLLKFTNLFTGSHNPRSTAISAEKSGVEFHLLPALSTTSIY